ncbi:GTP cyclohydrolase, FolE2/MptA family [Bacillus safensis]|uniref:GTP cyclohydrolase, FolE2/MptA family n=1 Tax=Bacillus safensis TaxID=561879 RepID=UPI003978CCE8
MGCDAQVTTLCPCSKEISEYGAHNQRSSVSIQVELFEQASLPDDTKTALLHIIESNTSAPLYPVLKRPDERKPVLVITFKRLIGPPAVVSFLY